jgi:hypothetical protein
MLKMKSVQIALACFALGLLMPACAIGQTACEKRDVSLVAARSLADTLARRTNSSPAGTNAEIQVERVPVSSSHSCLDAVTLSWADAFEGGIVIYRIEKGKRVLQAAMDFPGAHDPMPAGEGRVLFTYSSGRGSGQLAERTAVLCSLASDLWVVCADILTRQEVAATGYPPSDSLAKGMGFNMRSRVLVMMDTLVVTSDVLITRYGKHSPTQRTLVAKYPLP